MNIKKILLFPALLVALIGFCCGPALAAMDTAYVLTQDKNLEAAAPLLKYIKDSGTEYVLLGPQDISKLEGKEYFIVIGSPKDGDAISAFAKKVMSERQWASAQEMGKSGPIIVSAGEAEVLFLFSDYSLKSLISGSKDRWTEIFYDWYDIPLSITQIIGY